VHDENAAALGGVAGHAGAFATLAMAAEAAHAWLVPNTLTPATQQTATRRWSRSESGEHFGLGFRLTSPSGLGGDLAGRDGFGASGFVGNRLWIEPSRGYAVVILSNRIHPHRGARHPFDQWCDQLLTSIGLLWRP
jgi:CubicO group peptidase (beta-lactamase class C family)